MNLALLNFQFFLLFGVIVYQNQQISQLTTEVAKLKTDLELSAQNALVSSSVVKEITQHNNSLFADQVFYNTVLIIGVGLVALGIGVFLLYNSSSPDFFGALNNVTNENVTANTKVVVTEIEHLKTSVSILDAKVDVLSKGIASVSAANSIVLEHTANKVNHIATQVDLAVSMINLPTTALSPNIPIDAIDHTNTFLQFMA
jgi:hypothetical protein